MENRISTLEEMILFYVGDTPCGVDIRDVQEIKRVSEVTKVYGAPNVIKGVINLRGEIVSVLDLRTKFGIDSCEVTGKEHVMIFPYEGEQVGVIVDSVEDVITVDPSFIQSVPSNMAKDRGDLFSVVYQMEDSIVSIVSTTMLLVPENSEEASR